VHFSFETKYDREFWMKRGIANQKNSSILDGAGVDLNLFYPSEGVCSHRDVRKWREVAAVFKLDTTVP
jgi:hypothetical protein